MELKILMGRQQFDPVGEGHFENRVTLHVFESVRTFSMHDDLGIFWVTGLMQGQTAIFLVAGLEEDDTEFHPTSIIHRGGIVRIPPHLVKNTRLAIGYSDSRDLMTEIGHLIEGDDDEADID